MKKAILALLSFSIFFVGCAEKEPQTVFKDKLVCVEQQKLERIQPTQIRVYNDDVQVALEYKASIDMGFRFYENQIERNNNLCKEIEKLERGGK